MAIGRTPGSRCSLLIQRFQSRLSKARRSGGFGPYFATYSALVAQPVRASARPANAMRRPWRLSRIIGEAAGAGEGGVAEDQGRHQSAGRQIFAARLDQPAVGPWE